LSYGSCGASSHPRYFGIWHRIEYFHPFNLEEIIEDKEREVRILWPENLHSDTAEDIWKVALKPSERVLQFHLYLGVFDKSELNKLCTSGREAEGVRFDDQERADLEGRSCFAKLKFSPNGALQPDSLSVSTVPWAIGVVRHYGWTELSEDRFETDVQRLQDSLRSFLTERDKANEVSDEDGSEQPLTGPRLLQLGQLFYDWAEFHPEDQPLAVLDVRIKSFDESETTAPDVVGKTKVGLCGPGH
jgi:hypothetical protein